MEQENSNRTRASLLAKLRGTGDRVGWNAAWESFYRQYAPMIGRWCRRWGLGETEAEEVTAAVLFVLGRRMENFAYDPTSRFRGWLKTVVQNEVRGHFARLARKPGDRGVGGEETGRLEGVLDPGAAAEELEEELAEQRVLLARAMEEVRERVAAHTWEAFRRTAIEEESAEDVAKGMGMSVVAVYQAKSRVLKQVREVVDRLLAEES